MAESLKKKQFTFLLQKILTSFFLENFSIVKKTPAHFFHNDPSKSHMKIGICPTVRYVILQDFRTILKLVANSIYCQNLPFQQQEQDKRVKMCLNAYLKQEVKNLLFQKKLPLSTSNNTIVFLEFFRYLRFMLIINFSVPKILFVIFFISFIGNIELFPLLEIDKLWLLIFYKHIYYTLSHLSQKKINFEIKKFKFSLRLRFLHKII